MYVTDTHALIWYAEQKFTRLGKEARRIFQSAEEGTTLVYVPTPVLWELGRRLDDVMFIFPNSFDKWCRALDSADGFSIAPLEWQDVNEARHLPFKDPFDCLITGTAIRLGIPLITKDSGIGECALVSTVW